MRKNVEDLICRIDAATEQHETFKGEYQKLAKLWKIPTTADFLNLEFPPIQYLVGDWAAEGAPVLISGPTKCGKTILVYSLLHAISTGESFLGWTTPAGGVSVAIVDGEMRPQSIKKRLQAITKHSGRLGNLKIVTREFFSERGLPCAFRRFRSPIPK
jgi:RecA-family ATPase